MKNSKKFLAVLCAVCMVMAMAVPAMAADISVSARSENAGKTISVNVIHIQNGEEHSYSTDVSIPQNATEAEENRLIAAAGDKAAGIPQSRASNSSFKYLCGENGAEKINFSAMTAGDFSNDLVGSAYMTVSYDTLHLILSNPSTGVNRVAFRFENSAYAHTPPDDNVYESYPVSSGGEKTYIITDGSLLPNSGSDNPGAIHLDANTTLTVYCSGMKSLTEGIKGSCYMVAYLA